MIQTVAEIGSTNSALLARLADGQATGEGDWLVADRQTGGRGRAGRTWFDGLGNFMGSTVAWLSAGDPPAPTLALVAGVAVHRAISGLSPGLRDVWLKWPNDVLLAGAKLGGILLERQGDAVVVGIGVNLAPAPDLPDRPSASLRSAGLDIARDTFAEALAAQWSSALASWHLGDWPALRGEWLERAHPLGTRLMVRDAGGEPIEGTFAGLEPHGAALLRLADGAMRAIHAGEIELVRADAAGD
ncbi:biotin--[acetyl-CoA-carboxylase] ligase [Novosphingobium sp.]|uniref:biotin--[acetyl-CoA-carboxylase] ligase n=1 Tax=Novosphingobium sp. TaxID=1874826 RepID=UPI0025E1ACF6|nr:biotin--[acetyl-CoA-carboxylase] ligase [Novosphingobium sp.]